MPITRTPMVDDDGSGQSGTVVNNSWKSELYDQIDAALGGSVSTNGLWSPVLGSDAGLPTGQTYTFREGVWVRIGPLVWINGRVIIATRGAIGGSSLTLLGLPFPAATTQVAGGAGCIHFTFFGGLTTPILYLSGFVQQNKTSCGVYAQTAAAISSQGAPASLVTDGSDCQMSGCYLAA